MKLQTTQPTTQKNLTFGLTIILAILLGVVSTQARATLVVTTGLNNSPKIITAGQASLLATESGITAPDEISQSPHDGNSGIYAMNAEDGNQVSLTSNAAQEYVPRRNSRRSGPAHAVLFDYFGTGNGNCIYFTLLKEEVVT